MAEEQLAYIEMLGGKKAADYVRQHENKFLLPALYRISKAVENYLSEQKIQAEMGICGIQEPEEDCFDPRLFVVVEVDCDMEKTRQLGREISIAMSTERIRIVNDPQYGSQLGDIEEACLKISPYVQKKKSS